MKVVIIIIIIIIIISAPYSFNFIFAVIIRRGRRTRSPDSRRVHCGGRRHGVDHHTGTAHIPASTTQYSSSSSIQPPPHRTRVAQATCLEMRFVATCVSGHVEHPRCLRDGQCSCTTGQSDLSVCETLHFN